GDGDNVWPMIAPDKKLHYDCSKLDQWQVVFDHAQRNGVFLHFKLQETENDDHNIEAKGETGVVKAALDAGDLGPERKLYLRELVARFGYAPALNWNLGEENTQSTGQQRDMARYLRSIDPYGHLVVLHTYPNQQDKNYKRHLGDKTTLTGLSLQNGWNDAHFRTRQWVRASAESGHPWVVGNDEQNPASSGVPPNPGFKPAAGRKGAGDAKLNYTQDDIRKQTLWGTLMAGGAGVEYYFGYKLPENDLVCEDWRSRSGAWADCRVAIGFFAGLGPSLGEMLPADELVTVGGKAAFTAPKLPIRKKTKRVKPTAYCLAKPGESYLVYVLDGGVAELDLSDADGGFSIAWFNPREGGEPIAGTVSSVDGGGRVAIGAPPTDDDWLAIVERE
ncbi:MAG: putative collagen-binding domain-containing protein, partial [Planctomycetota bacterium]